MAIRRQQQLDDVDRELCRLLMAEPRTSLRDLAAQTGVTNETVAARLRRLRESNVLALTVAIDWEAAGYKVGALVRLKVSSRAAALLKPRLAACPDVQFAAVATGACDLVIAVLSSDHAGLRTTLRSVLGGISDVSVQAVDIVTEVLTYDVNALTLPVTPWSPDTLPGTSPPLDELDRELLQQLTLSGHESNREIGRRLKISDATVRTRIRRMENSGLIRLIAGVDPVAAGGPRLFAMAFVSLDDDSLIMPLVKRDTVSSAFATIGRSDVAIHFSGASPHEMSDYITREVAGLEGIRGIETVYLAEVITHQSHLIRFV